MTFNLLVDCHAAVFKTLTCCQVKLSKFPPLTEMKHIVHACQACMSVKTDLVVGELWEPQVCRGHEEPEILADGSELVGTARRQ